MFLRGMWQATQLAAGAGGIVVGVGGERPGRPVLGVAADADRVARHGAEAIQIGGPIGRVRIVAGDARHAARAPAEQEVARLARGDRAAPRVVPPLRPPPR